MVPPRRIVIVLGEALAAFCQFATGPCTLLAMAARTRIAIVVFDALRPDMVSEATMPTLYRFAEDGVRFARSRATFPTETRVNQSALVTGCHPNRHGIVGNQFVDLVASPDKLFNTGDEDALRAGDLRLGGRLFGVKSMGELLYEHGASLATLSAGTPGGARILHHRAESTGGFRLSLNRPDATCGPMTYAALSARFGAIPPPAIPSVTWLAWATDVYLEYVQAELRPDVSVLWMCEPDNSYHHYGVGSKESMQALASADAEFARIHAWWQGQPDVQLITLSDHGQIAALGEPVAVASTLHDAGFRVGPVPIDGNDLAVSLDNAGGVYLANADNGAIDRVIECLAKQPWCGVLSTHSGRADSLCHADLLIDHARAPDVAMVLAADGAPGPYGLPGTTAHDSKYGGGGVHGGLSRFELNNWMAMAGSRLQASTESALPAGLIDILPTLLVLLDLPVPPHIQGRVLTEAFRGAGANAGEAVDASIDIPGQSRQLIRERVGDTYYLNRLQHRAD